MDERIRRAALRAALKTAIIVSLSGCYDAHSRPLRAASTDAGRGTRDTGSAWVADAASRPDSPDSPAVPSSECSAYLSSLTLAGDWCPGFTDEAVAVAPRTAACCAEQERAVAAGAAPSPEYALATACCWAVTFAGLSSTIGLGPDCGCAVGGPMVPPEMPNQEVA